MHHLPLGHDGQCIQCRREVELGQMAQSRSGYQVFVNVLGVLLVLGGCAAAGTFFVWPWWQKANENRSPALDELDDQESVAAAAQGVDEPGVERRWGRPSYRRRQKEAVRRSPKTSVRSTTRQRLQNRSSLRGPHHTPKVKIIRSEVDRPSSGVAAASRRVRVVVYVTSWCPACSKARRWLRRKNIRHTLHNVERDRAARQELRSLNPRGSIPTFKIGRQVLVGFSAQAVTRAIMRASR